MDFTTRLGLQKPDPDPVTGDFVDVQVLNDNSDAIDGVISFTICTNPTRPSPPFAGQAILETDTGDAYVWGGSSWLSLSTALHPAGTNTAQTEDFLVSVRTIAGDWAFGARRAADANPRFLVKADGRLDWGPGTSGTDTSIFRTAVGELTTPGALVVGGGLTISGGMVVGGGIDWNGATTVYAFTATAGTTASLTYVLPTTASVGLVFVAPPSGKVKINWSSEITHSVANGWSQMSPNVRTGNVIGSGTVFLAANDFYSTRCRSATAAAGGGTGGDKTMTNFYLLTGLTPGSSYNVQLYARVNTVGTGNFELQTLMVEPML